MTAALDDLNLNEARLEPNDTPTRTRKPRSDKGQSRSPRGISTKRLADDLLIPWATLAASVSMTFPTVAAIMLERGEKTVDALVGIAQQHPKMLKALKTASKFTPFSELAATAVSMATAVALDMGRIPPDHPFAVSLGVADLYQQTHPQPVDHSYPIPTPFPHTSGM